MILIKFQKSEAEVARSKSVKVNAPERGGESAGSMPGCSFGMAVIRIAYCIFVWTDIAILLLIVMHIIDSVYGVCRFFSS